MDVKIFSCFFLFIPLLCSLVSGDLEGRKMAHEVLVGTQIDIKNGKINEDMAEALQIICRIDLTPMRDSSEVENLHKTIRTLQPWERQIILDCLKKENFLHGISRKEVNSEKWYSKFFGMLFARPDVPIATERTHGRDLLQNIASSPSPSPSLSPVTSQSPFYARNTSFPPEPNDSVLQTNSSKNSPSPEARSAVESKHQSNSRKSVIIAVVVTTTVTSVIFVLLFLCYYKCRTSSGARWNDNRPLLSLSLSDFSMGSTPHGNSPINEKLSKTNPLGVNFFVGSDFLNASVIDANSSTKPHDGSSIVSAQPPLKPPPGMFRVNSPSLNPLNGRVEPSFSEQASFKMVPNLVQPPRTSSPPPPPSIGLRPPLVPNSAPPPPPPKMGLIPPRPPIPMGPMAPRPPNDPSTFSEADSAKAKLKPFFWDKVQANPDHSMVWHDIKSGSFQFNEEMIESLFGFTAPENKGKGDRKKDPSSQDPSYQCIQIIDSKKAQNLAILLRALNVTIEEVCDALNEGNELPMELLETLLKMPPTSEEELKLRLFSGKLSQLGPAERFLKVLISIPFAFKRMESLLFMTSFQEEVVIIKESFATLEVACKEVRNSRLFLKLLEAVLKTGNRMNIGTFRGGAQAFKLDTLLKLSDVKGTDGKTTLLHFVVQEIIRSEGIRAARAARESRSLSSIKSDDLLEDYPDDSEESYCSLGLHVVSGLSSELENVRRAALLDSDALSGSVLKLTHALAKAKDFLNSEMNAIEVKDGFHRSLEAFLEHVDMDVTWVLGEEKRIVVLVKSTANYFHGNAGKDEGIRLFAIVRDFLIMLAKVCKEVKDSERKPSKSQKKEVPVSHVESRASPSHSHDQRLFPAIADRRVNYSSSDEESG